MSRPTRTASEHSGIGARIPRRELKRLVSGRGRYVDDITLPRMLHICFVRSPRPHAKIRSIDVSKAEALEGVYGTLTPDERAELEAYSHAAAFLNVLQSKARSSLRHSVAVSGNGTPAV